jgi:hypothetical protein
MCALLTFSHTGALAQTGVTVSFKDSTVTLPAGATRQFTPTVTGTTNTAVTWAVEGIVGGNAVVGTIDATGRAQPSAPLSKSPPRASQTPAPRAASR